MATKMEENDLEFLYLKVFCLEHNIKYSNLAEQLYISKSLLSKFENGSRRMHTELFQSFTNQYQIDIKPFDFSVLGQIHRFVSIIVLCKEDEEIIEEINLDETLLSYPYAKLALFCKLFCEPHITIAILNLGKEIIKYIHLFEEEYQQIFYSFYGYVLYRNDEFEFARKCLYQALTYSYSNDLYYLTCYYLSGFFRNRKELLEARNYGEQAIEYYTKTNNYLRLGKAYINTSYVYGDLKIYDIAKEDLIKSKEVYNDLCINRDIAYNFNMGYFHMEQKEYNQAIEYFFKSKALENDGLTCFYLAYCYFNNNQNAKAREMIKEGKNLPIYNNFSKIMLDWLEAMLNSRYCKKSEKYLEILDKSYDSLSYTDKQFLNNLLIEHYEYKEDFKKIAYFYKRKEM